MSFAGKKHAEESKRKMSRKWKGANNPFYGKTHTKETLARLSANAKRQMKEKGNAK